LHVWLYSFVHLLGTLKSCWMADGRQASNYVSVGICIWPLQQESKP
jgi:hypothetical protein